MDINVYEDHANWIFKGQFRDVSAIPYPIIESLDSASDRSPREGIPPLNTGGAMYEPSGAGIITDPLVSGTYSQGEKDRPVIKAPPSQGSVLKRFQELERDRVAEIGHSSTTQSHVSKPVLQDSEAYRQPAQTKHLDSGRDPGNQHRKPPETTRIYAHQVNEKADHESDQFTAEPRMKLLASHWKAHGTSYRRNLFSKEALSGPIGEVYRDGIGREGGHILRIQAALGSSGNQQRISELATDLSSWARGVAHLIEGVQDPKLQQAIAQLTQLDGKVDGLIDVLPLIPGILNQKPVIYPLDDELRQTLKLRFTLLEQFWYFMRDTWGAALYSANARLPACCSLGDTISVVVQLVVRNAQDEYMVIEPTSEELQSAEVPINVIVSAPNFQCNPPYRFIRVPLGESSDIAQFTLTALIEGNSVVHIEFLHGSVRIGYIVARVDVRPIYGKTSNDKAAFAVLEEVREDLLAEPREILKYQPDLRLLVTCTSGKGISYQAIRKGETVPEDLGSVQWKLSRHSIRDYMRDLQWFVSGHSLYPETEEDKETIWMSWRGKGQQLWDAILPPKLRQEVSDLPEKSIVMISSDEAWIPWEILFDEKGKEFWGYKHILARVPKHSGRNDQPLEAVSHFGYESGPVERVLNVVGKIPVDIGPGTLSLFNTHKVKIQLLQTPEKSVFRDSTERADIIQITSHGHSYPPHHCLQLGITHPSQFGCLEISDVNQLGDLSGALVFANACLSATDSSTLLFDKLRTFGWAFCARGAGAYIGTLASVPSRPALAFAESFYSELLAGKCLGEAVWLARSKQKAGPFSLLYVLYGNPFLTRTPAAL